MTRINVVPVEELTRKHLQGEYREITRVFGYVRKAQNAGLNTKNLYTKKKIPKEYRLGTGHVLFFYDKLGYILDRYYSLANEMVRRGYKPNPIDSQALTARLHPDWFGEYSPTKDAVEINRTRISKRLAGDKGD